MSGLDVIDLGLVVWALLALATAAGMLAEWVSRRRG